MKKLLALFLLLLARTTWGQSAVVAPTCPHPSNPVCYTTVQAAVTALEAGYPNVPRDITIQPGLYVGTVTVTVTTGTTRISGVGPIGIFGQNGAVRLKAPTDGIAKPVVDWRAPGQLANVEIIIGTDANDVGLRIQGNVLPELTVRDVNVTGALPPGGRAIENIRYGGFVEFRDVNAIMACANANASSAVYYENTAYVFWTETVWEGGWLSLYTNNCPAGAALVEIPQSSLGDDIHGTVLRDLTLECKPSTTCLELSSNLAQLTLVRPYLRGPVGQFVKVTGTQTGGKLRLEQVEGAHEVTASVWGPLVPTGTFHIVGGTPPLPCFTGWLHTNDTTGDNSQCISGAWKLVAQQ
jgi:hypothetical protein